MISRLKHFLISVYLCKWRDVSARQKKNKYSVCAAHNGVSTVCVCVHLISMVCDKLSVRAARFTAVYYSLLF